MLQKLLPIQTFTFLMILASFACEKPTSFALKDSTPSFQTQKVWDLLANRSARQIIEDSYGQTPVLNSEIDAASKVIYSDFLIYMNEIGVKVELAKMAVKHQMEAESLQPGAMPYCSENDLKNWNEISMQALELDFSAFQQAYCDRSCIDEQDLSKTVLDPVSCELAASKLFNAYQCDDNSPLDGVGTSPDSIPNPDEVSHENREEPRVSESELTSNSDRPRFEGSTSIDEPNHGLHNGLASGNGTHLNVDLNPMPASESSAGGRLDFSSAPENSGGLTPPRTPSEKVARKLARCGRASEISWIITTPDPIGQHPQGTLEGSAGTSMGRTTPIDPIMKLEMDQILEGLKPAIESACETIKPESEDTHSLIMAAYQLIRFQAIESNFGHLAIGDEKLSANRTHTISIDGHKLEHTYDPEVLNGILAEADSFFIPLLKSTDSLKDMRVCSESEGKDPEDADRRRELDELIRDSNPLRAFGEALINGISLGAEKTGMGANAPPLEFGMILHGEMNSQQIKDYIKSLEIKGDGSLKELVTFLENNQHYPVVEFLGEVTGSVITGAGIAGVSGVASEVPTAAKALSRLASEEAGFLTKIFAGTIESIKGKIASFRNSGFVNSVMKPFASSESGHIGAGYRVLQSGGHTLNNSTARELNKQFGKELERREWGRALEKLKKKYTLQNDHHGKILSNGDYMDSRGRIVDNIEEYLY